MSAMIWGGEARALSWPSWRVGRSQKHATALDRVEPTRWATKYGVWYYEELDRNLWSD
jgi:hypothetical protein